MVSPCHLVFHGHFIKKEERRWFHSLIFIHGNCVMVVCYKLINVIAGAKSNYDQKMHDLLKMRLDLLFLLHKNSFFILYQNLRLFYSALQGTFSLKIGIQSVRGIRKFILSHITAKLDIRIYNFREKCKLLSHLVFNLPDSQQNFRSIAALQISLASQQTEI